MTNKILVSLAAATLGLTACATTGQPDSDSITSTAVEPRFGKVVAYLPPLNSNIKDPRFGKVIAYVPPLETSTSPTLALATRHLRRTAGIPDTDFAPLIPEADDIRVAAVSAPNMIVRTANLDLAGLMAQDLPSDHEKGLGNEDVKIANLGSGPGTEEASLLAAFQDVPGKAGWTQTPEGFLHTHSGMLCEVSRSVAGVEADTKLTLPLSDIVVYDEKGYDTSCHYRAADKNIFFSYYASYWPEVNLDQHLQGTVFSMNKSMSFLNVLPLTIADLKKNDNGGYSGTIEGETKGAGFSHLYQGASVKSGVWLNKTGGWHIKEWATYPKDQLSIEVSAALFHMLTLLKVDSTINGNDAPQKPDQTEA